MEQKKTLAADIDNRRGISFLLGLVMALALLLTALEWTSHATDTEEAPDLVGEMAQDLEAIPALDQRDLVALTRQQPATTVVSERVVVADDATEDIADAADAARDEWVPLVLEPDDFTEEPVNNEALSPLAMGITPEPVLRVVEQYPEFPGGMMELMKWLTRNLQYPAYARQQKIQGEVVASFIINKDGTVADIKILKSVEASLDREALRVLRMMPAWKPGQDHGQPCRTLVRLPIVFKI